MFSAQEPDPAPSPRRHLGGVGFLSLAVPQALLLAWLICVTQPNSAQGGEAPVKDARAADVSRVYGKIQFVESFPDYKVQIVDSFPDLRVQKVTSFPDGPGKWEIVSSGADYKIQIVNSFPDFKVKYVESFPGAE